MAIEGSLTAGGGADLLVALRDGARTGLLDLTTGEVERKLVLSGGDVVYLSSSVKSEKLPLRLVAGGHAPKDAVVEASRAGKDLREELSKREALSADRYDAVLREIIAEAVTAVFALTDGRWALVDKAQLELPGALAENDLAPVLWKASRSCPADFAKGFVGDPGRRVLRKGDDALLERLPDLSPQEGFLVSRIDGYGSVRDLTSAGVLSEEQTHRLLVGLTCVGLVDVDGRPRVSLPRAGVKGGASKARPKPRPQAKTKTTPSPAAGAHAARADAQASPEEAELATSPLEAARELLEKVRGGTHYDALRLGRDAATDEIRKSYYALAKRFHPDRVGRDAGDQDRALIEELFGRISDAFAVLSDETTRAEYDEKLDSGQLEEEDAGPVDPRQLAKESFDKGRGLLAMGERARALRFLEHAVDTDPDNWEYRMTLGKLLVSDSRLRKKGEQHLLEAIRIQPARAEAHYQLALLYKAVGIKSRALEYLQKGLEWDADHEGMQALRRELEGDEGDKPAGGLLGGLFGKKE